MAQPGSGGTAHLTAPDFPLFAALPGARAVFAPRLLVAFGEQRERYASADERQQYAGIAPVTNAAARKPGSIGVGSVPSSCAKR